MHDEHYCYHTGVEGRRGEQGPSGGNGYSPTVEIERVRRGHEVRITDLDGEHVFTVRDGFDGSGLLARDGEGGCWYGPRLEDDGDTGLIVEDSGDNVWYYPVGEGAVGDAIVGDEDEDAWYMPECGEGPPGPQGPVGPQGETGPQGPAGPQGDSAADLLGIVIDGKRPPMVVSAGQYVIVRGSTITGVTDGLYTAVNALSPSTDVTAADLTAVSGGGLNDLCKVIDITNQCTDLSQYLTECKVLKCGNRIDLYVMISAGANDQTRILTIPAEYSPSTMVPFAVYYLNYVDFGKDVHVAILRGENYVEFRRKTATSGSSGVVAYGSWLIST